MDKTEFLTHVLANPINRQLLERLASFGLNECWLVSGCLFQSVWNGLTGRDPGYGIHDYDIIYFDNNDLTWEAENNVIKRITAGFHDLSVPIEIRNQARVHLWYEEKFGLPYKALTNATESIDRYLAVSSMVGLSHSLKGDFEVYAPKGLHDIQSLEVRPNPSPSFCAEAFAIKADRWKAFWPEISVVSPVSSGREII